MPPYSNPNSQSCVWCGRNGWLLRTERFLSASCMGWCLHASFKEHPTSTSIAYAGGASGIYLTNYFLSRLASSPANARLLHAGGLISVGGVAFCLNVAFDQHPNAAMKACLAGALSICLAKSVLFSDPSASLEEAPNKEEASKKKKAPKVTIAVRMTDISDLYYNYSPYSVELSGNVMQIGKELSEIAEYFDRRKSGENNTDLNNKKDENNNEDDDQRKLKEKTKEDENNLKKSPKMTT